MRQNAIESVPCIEPQYVELGIFRRLMNISIILSSMPTHLRKRRGKFFFGKEHGGKGFRLTGVALAQHQRSSKEGQ